MVKRPDLSSLRLRPHESAETDVVLLGHSMGGILSADVVLSPLNHRILGTINFDTPFLGMHPGVVVSGIGSLFRPGDATPQPQSQDQGSQALLPIPNGDYVLGKPQNNGSILQQVSNNEYSVPSQFSSPGPSSPALSTSLSSPLSGVSNPMNDPNYNPRFENDVVLPVRKGWDSALHFVMKHSDGLTKATKEYVTSHLEFSGTMADYKGLRTRYEQIRALEDIDDRRTTASQYRSTRRVRFVNYYTASTGRISKPKSSSPVRHGQTKAHQESSIDNEMQDLQLATTSSASRPESLHPVDESQTQQSKSTQDKTNADSDEHSETKSVPESDPDMEHVDPMPLVEDDEPDRLEEGPSRKPTDDSGITRAESTKSSSQAPLNLPPIPPEPSKPEDFDPNTYEDKDVRKLAEKEHARKMKAYSRDVKDREKAVSSRQKMIEKREKNARKAEEKVLKEEKKIQAKEEKEKKKRIAAEETEAAPNATRVSTETSQAKNDATSHEDKGKGKVKRDRKFCILPSKGANGERDPIWIRVFMEGLDEVGAHCGLFFVDRPHYTQFVTNVGEKLKEWVERDRMIREER